MKTTVILICVILNLGYGGMAGGQDLQHAYLQLPLEINSKQYTTINTHWGSVPVIFQRAIDDLVKGIP